MLLTEPGNSLTLDDISGLFTFAASLITPRQITWEEEQVLQEAARLVLQRQNKVIILRMSSQTAYNYKS